MKKWKLFFTMAISAFLIGMSVCSCQMNDDDGYYQEAAVDVTPADLFIASEAYQNLEKEIRKDIRRRQNAIEKLSREEKEMYQQLMEQLLNPETRMDAREQLNSLLGYDEQIERNRILVMARKVYEGVNVSQLELLRAWQRRQMQQVVISTRAKDPEALEECKKKCTQNMEREVNECYAELNYCLESVPADEKLYQSGPQYDACINNLNYSLDFCYFVFITCKDSCKFSHGG